MSLSRRFRIRFIVDQRVENPACFVLTDSAHEVGLRAAAGAGKGALTRVGDNGEMGRKRLAFDESLADEQGRYPARATTFAYVAATAELPG